MPVNPWAVEQAEGAALGSSTGTFALTVVFWHRTFGRV